MHYNISSVIKRTVYKCLLLSALLFAAFSGSAQNNCFSVKLSTADARQGDTVAIQVQVNGFKNIVSYGFTLQWAPDQLQYMQYSSAGSLLHNQLFNPLAGNQGVFRSIWFDENLTGVTLLDGSTLFTLYFKVLSAAPGFYPVKIEPDLDPVYEFYDNYSNFYPFANIIGGVRLGLPSGDLGIDALCVTVPTCLGNFGDIRCQVSGGTAPYNYHWEGPDNFSSDQEIPIMLQPGAYRLTVTDAAGVQAMAQAKFSSGQAVMSVYHLTQNAVCNAANGCANIYANGGTGPYAVQWSVPGSNNFSRCDLPEGGYKVTVSDSKGCLSVDSFFVNKDSTIEVVMQTNHADCRFDTPGNIQLQHPGTAPFQYQWSNGAQSPNLENLSIGQYAVTVHDAQGCVGQAVTELKDYGTFDWNFYQYYTCDNSTKTTNVQLQGYALAQRAKAPLTIAWDNGTRQQVDSTDESKLYQDISLLDGLPAAAYHVTITDADGCSFVKYVYPSCDQFLSEWIQVGPHFSIRGYDNSGKITVYGKGLKGLKSIRFSLYWDNSRMQLKDLNSYSSYLPLVNAGNFTLYPNGGRLDFHYEYPVPSGIYSNYATTIFEANFTGDNHWTNINFKSFPDAPISLLDKDDSPIAFIGRGGAVYFNYDADYSDFDFNVIPPSCSNNGFARVQLKGGQNSSPYRSIYSEHHVSNPGGGETIAGDELLHAEPGYWEFYTPSSGNYTVHIPDAYAPFSEGLCIWPGDADRNGAVNHYDLLYTGLGMGLGKKIHASTFTPGQWDGAIESDWEEQTPLSHINFKNMDLDGSGMITAADTSVIMDHWMKRVDIYNGKQPFSMPAADSIDAQRSIIIDLNNDTLPTGAVVRIPLRLAADDILGLAFSISYDHNLMDTNSVQFEPAASWLGAPSTNLIQVQKNFPGQDRLDVALTRTDRENSSGSGIIGYLVCRFQSPNAQAFRKTSVFISHILTINTNERKLQLGESKKDLVLLKGVSAANEPGDGGEVLLSPNPVGRQLTISSMQWPLERVDIFRSDAGWISAIQPDLPEKIIRLDVANLSPGLYFAKIYVQGQAFVRPFVVAR